MKGLFVSFEGIDGCGKTLMLRIVADKLKETGYDVLCTREPGGSELGRQIRRILLESPLGAVDERTETLLYAADRALHVAQVIKPALDAGKIVLSDRYVDSSFAYQGSGRRVDEADVRIINEFATYGLMPDITFLLDLPAEAALSRLGGEKDRLEQEDVSFFARTAAAFRNLAAAEPERFVMVNATQPIEQEWRQIMDVLVKRLERR